MLKEIYKLEVELELLTGLHIGGSETGFDIGGADSKVIKNPLTQEPYIPGSTIKGKLRSLLQYSYGKINGKEIKFNNDTLANIFEPLKDGENKVLITRGIFRDFCLSQESKTKLFSILGDQVYTEIKAENKINALKGTADNPRFIERVPAGVSFQGEIVLSVFDGDDKEEMMKYIKEALQLLEHNYLGGSGTRGYGRVKVHCLGDFTKVNVDENI